MVLSVPVTFVVTCQATSVVASTVCAVQPPMWTHQVTSVSSAVQATVLSLGKQV